MEITTSICGTALRSGFLVPVLDQVGGGVRHGGFAASRMRSAASKLAGTAAAVDATRPGSGSWSPPLT